MTASSLPQSPSLEQLRRQAKDLVKAYLARDPDAIRRIGEHHSKTFETSHLAFTLADAQFVIAREFGFANWARLKLQLLFLEAVAAIDTGSISALDTLLVRHPKLIAVRGIGRDYYDHGYFSGAVLLHHVAGNPYRGPLPSNIVAIARRLIDTGADPRAKTLAGADTLELVLTSRHASESGASPGLIDLLVQAGVPLDVSNGEALTSSILQDGLGAAEELIRRGARIDIRSSAGLGRTDLMESFFNPDGSLTQNAISSPERFVSDQEAVEEALIFAIRRHQSAAAQLLIERGARGDLLISAGGETARTALHEAAVNSDFDLVRILVKNGARTDARDGMFNGTPADWAAHGGHSAVVEYLQESESHK